jgi:hypothetical protein
MLWALANLHYIPGTPLLEAAGNALLTNLALCAPKQAAQVRACVCEWIYGLSGAADVCGKTCTWTIMHVLSLYGLLDVADR